MAYRSVIDVSENQGAIDFGRMAAAGVDGVIPRAGINGRRDHRLDEYVAGIRANGRALPAVYWFANPRSSTGAAGQGSLLAAAATRVQWAGRRSGLSRQPRRRRLGAGDGSRRSASAAGVNGADTDDIQPRLLTRRCTRTATEPLRR